MTPTLKNIKRTYTNKNLRAIAQEGQKHIERLNYYEHTLQK